MIPANPFTEDEISETLAAMQAHLPLTETFLMKRLHGMEAEQDREHLEEIHEVLDRNHLAVHAIRRAAAYRGCKIEDLRIEDLRYLAGAGRPIGSHPETRKDTRNADVLERGL